MKTLNPLDIARKAIADEISQHEGEIARLKRILGELTGGTVRRGPGRPPASQNQLAASSEPKRRGRKPKPKPEFGEADLKKALGVVESEGKEGVKAIRLAFLLRKANLAQPSKADLVNSGKIKVTGTGGGTTYTYTG